MFFAQVLAMPSFIRRHASTAQPVSDSDMGVLNLDPVDQLSIFGDKGRGRGALQ